MPPDAPTPVPVADLTVPHAVARAFPPDRGAVTRLSPYLTHGLVSVPEVLAAV